MPTPKGEFSMDVESEEEIHQVPKYKDRRYLLQGAFLGIFLTAFIIVNASFFSVALEKQNSFSMPIYSMLCMTVESEPSLRYVYATNGTIHSDDNILSIVMKISTVGAEAYEVVGIASVQQIPLSMLNHTTGKLLKPLVVTVGNTAIQITANTTNPFIDLAVKVPLTAGDFRYYPFDTYEAEIPYGVSIGFGQLDGSSDVIPFPTQAIFYETKSSGWVTTFKEETPPSSSSSKDNSTIVKLKFKRVGMSFIYIAIMFIGIWAVTIGVGYIGCAAVIWEYRAPDNPVLFLSALFAVPAFRNTAPDKPPYGCAFDMLCTFWSILVIVICLLMTALKYAVPKTK